MGENADHNNNEILPLREVLYCGACGMPLEYCEYGPDFETHCNPWLKKYNAELFKELRGAAMSQKKGGSSTAETTKPPRPERPWTTEERLTAFYKKYVPEKVDAIPGLLEKYAGKEDNLFVALVKKYGEEPDDPYYDDDDDDEDEEDDDDDDDDDNNDGEGQEGGGDNNDDEGNAVAPSAAERRKRRGVAAKHTADAEANVRVVVQKVAQKKKRNLTVITGMETIPGLKLKDASKAFSKRFAGSSSVKKTVDGKGEEIIIQGDHVYDVAEMIVDKFNVPESAVFIDIGDGSLVPLR
ncbi:hypothetical protein ACA910_015109 [Epithemia clementina (nom. ined.)]